MRRLIAAPKIGAIASAQSQRKRRTPRAAILEHEADRVHAVRAIMREDRNRDRDADARRRLKADPER